MKIAYIISAYKLPQQVIRLVNRLNSDSASFIIHVDRKTKLDIFLQIKQELSKYNNVYLLKRHVCHWAGYGHVKSTIKGIQEIFKRNISFEYLILLTGQDYPIKSNRYIEKMLEENKGKLFIEHSPIPRKCWGHTGGVETYEFFHFWFFGRHYYFPRPGSHNLIVKLLIKFKYKRKIPYQYKPFAGSSYWCLSKDCVEYVYKFMKANRAYELFFRNVFLSDEIFFQTLIMNSPFRNCVVNDDLRYIEWPADSYNPQILQKKDFSKFMSSADLFARKFDMTVDSEVLDMIDREISKNNHK